MGDDKALTAPSILFLADYGASGGTRTYFKQLLALYAEKHARVTVVRTYEEADDEIDSLCHQYGFTCVGLSSVVGDNDILRGKSIARYFLERHSFRNFVRKTAADVVVASVGAPELFLGAVNLASKSIYILHTYPHTSKNILKGFLRRMFFSIFVSSSTKILTVSEYSRKRILQAWGLWGRTSNVEVIYSTAGDSVSTASIAGAGAINILTVGHVVPYKNPDTWINVALLFKRNSPDLNIRFKWLGDGSLLSECRDRVKRLGFESFVSFAGHDDDVASHYRQCDIYFQPSLIESLGLSVLDAMRYGKPCIVANTGGLPEVVSDGESGWVVDADNVEEMAYRVEMLAKDKMLRGVMGQRATKIYEERFSLKRWAKEMWRIHGDMLKT